MENATEEKVMSVTRKTVNGTVYIIENAVSRNARETVYDKIKRLVLMDAEHYFKKVS